MPGCRGRILTRSADREGDQLAWCESYDRTNGLFGPDLGTPFSATKNCPSSRFAEMKKRGGETTCVRRGRRIAIELSSRNNGETTADVLGVVWQRIMKSLKFGATKYPPQNRPSCTT
jgi:hypothetical protein